MAERGILEEASDAFGDFESAHVVDDVALQFLQAAGRRLARSGLLQITVDGLVRVDFRTVGRQVEHLDLWATPGRQSFTMRA